MNQPIPGEERAQERPITFKLLTAGLVLLFLALGFNALLTYGSLEKLYVESIVSSYQVIGKDLQRKLDQSLRFGKNIQKFIGMNQLLEETKAHLVGKADYDLDGAVLDSSATEGERRHRGENVDVFVALPDGKILYSADEKHLGRSLPVKVLPDYAHPQPANSPMPLT